MKIVINGCFGGFNLSAAAIEALESRGIVASAYSHCDDEHRASPSLVEVVEALGSEKASGTHARLYIVEIPDDVQWHIAEYDGCEWVAEDHRYWR